MRCSRLATAVAAAALLLLPAAPASAAPHGSARPVTEVYKEAELWGVTGLTYPVTFPNIVQERPSGTATPGTVTETYSNEFGFITIRNANLAISSYTQDGPWVTIHDQVRGLQQLVTTSDSGPHPELTTAGRFEVTVVFNEETGETPVFEITSTGREASGDFCAVAIAALT